MENKTKSCSFIGHRKIEDKESIKIKLAEIVERLISENVDTFIVGSRSDFNALSREVLDKKKVKYPHIKRIYVRAEYPDINEDYENYLLERCEETYFPEKIRNAGKSIYIERNCIMIDNADICAIYLNKDYPPKSGTGMAYEYALDKKREIINLAK